MTRTTVRLAIPAVAVLVTAMSVGCQVDGAKEPATPVPSQCGIVSGRLVPRCGALWGVTVAPGGPGDELGPLRRVEAAGRRKMAIVHRYRDMSAVDPGTFPDRAEQEVADGRLLFIAWASRTYAGRNYTWAQVAAGELDATVIDPAARSAAAFGRPMFLDFDHEADAHENDGPDKDFVAAYRHVYERFSAAGATNVVWVWTVTGYFTRWNRYDDLYPGDDVVDWIAYDPYNFAQCLSTSWVDFAAIIKDFYNWLVEHHPNKPIMLAEYGTAPSPAGPRETGRWYEDVVPVLTRNPRLKAVVQFDYRAPQGATCDTRLQPAEVLEAFSRAGRQSYVNPPLPTL